MGSLGPPTFGANVQPGFGPPGAIPGGYPPQAPEYAGQLYGAPPPGSMVGMPSAFDATNQVPDIQGMQGGMGSVTNLPSLAEIDLSIQCDPSFLSCTVNKLHVSQVSAASTRIPLGVVCKPMAGDVGTTNDRIEVVDFGTTGIVRCKRCRTYVNPFVSWIDNGRRWRCNICGMLNDVPTSYFSHLDANGHRRDRDQRPELSRCSVEFVAPGDYMVRPPQPPVYIFVIDVSSTSSQSGMLESCVRAIKESLDDLPGLPRTQIGFITFDSSVHFYNLKASLAAPQMLVVSDLQDIALPLPEDLLVNLQDSRKVVDALLEALPNMFAQNAVNVSCTGPAVLAGKKIIQHIGGKLCLFQSSLPTIGEGSLKVRDNPRALGTDKEHMLLTAEDTWYKNNAIDFSRLQVSVDTFLFSPQYTDLATISQLSRYTAGSTYYYPGFYSRVDGKKFERELRHCLTRATAFEAVMRVRATRGVRISNYYGNYFIRGQDLLALPCCTSDSTFALDLAYDEPTLAAQVITIQAALLYTSSNGERRIRVHTQILPVTQSVPDVVESIDIDCVVNLLLKQAVEIAIKTGFENARSRVHQLAVEMLRGCRPQLMGSGYGIPGQYGQPQQQSQDATMPASLQLLPLYAMAIQKSLALRGGAEIRIDERAFYHQLALNMDLEEAKVFVYPRLFSLHDMPPEAGLPADDGIEDESLVVGPFKIKLPYILNLSHERLSSEGVYLLENGFEMIMRVGRNTSSAILQSLFGIPSIDGVDLMSLELQVEGSDLGSRAKAVVVGLRADRARYLQLRIVREGDGHAEAYLARFLVEDR
jgi:protein transport protein SEC24